MVVYLIVCVFIWSIDVNCYCHITEKWFKIHMVDINLFIFTRVIVISVCMILRMNHCTTCGLHGTHEWVAIILFYFITSLSGKLS